VHSNSSLLTPYTTCHSCVSGIRIATRDPTISTTANTYTPVLPPSTPAMEVQRTPPPYTHGPVNLGPAPALPDELARFRAHGDITLPNLQTVLSGDFEQSATAQRSSKIPGSPTSPRSLPRIEPRPQHVTRESVETAVASPSEAGSVVSTDNGIRQSADETTSEEVQMREAAEALAVLGNPGELDLVGIRVNSR